MRLVVRGLLVVYGVLLIVGGTMGYVSKGSMPSLVAGVASGVLAIVAFTISVSKPKTGLLVGFLVAGGVGGMMAKRYFADGAGFMPAGLVAILSALMCVAIVGALFGGGQKR